MSIMYYTNFICKKKCFNTKSAYKYLCAKLNKNGLALENITELYYSSRLEFVNISKLFGSAVFSK